MAKKKKNDSNSKFFLVVVLVIFLVSSIASVVLYRNNDEDNSFTYDTPGGKMKFTRMADSKGNYYFEISSKDRKFLGYFLPDTIGINIDNQTKNLIRSSPYFYLTFDPDSSELSFIDYLRFDLRKNIPSEKFFIDSITNSSLTYNLPIIDCRNATRTVPVINLKSTNSTTSITSDNGCVNIEFSKLSALRIRDTLVYLVNNIEVK
ncbi:MAG: hypothetical protein ABIJ34_00960 [archaeon]